jgi:hypothetical protein
MRRRWRRAWASSPVSAARTVRRLRGRPRWPVRMGTVSSSGRTWVRSSPLAGVVRVAHGMPAASVRLWMRSPWPFRPSATPSPPPLPGGQGALHGPVLPLNHPVCCGNPEAPGLHGGERAIDLPALQPPVRGALGRPLGTARELTPAAPGDQDVEQGIDHDATWGVRHAPTTLRRLWRKHIGNQFPLQVTSPLEGPSHDALLHRFRALEHGYSISGIDSCVYPDRVSRLILSPELLYGAQVEFCTTLDRR